MNIPSDLLIDAITFAKQHKDVRQKLSLRDNSPHLSARSVKSEVYSIDYKNRLLYIKLLFDYVEKIPNIGTTEDIIVYMVWKEPNSFAICNIHAVNWVS